MLVVNMNNARQSKLFNWDLAKQFVITDLLISSFHCTYISVAQTFVNICYCSCTAILFLYFILKFVFTFFWYISPTPKGVDRNINKVIKVIKRDKMYLKWQNRILLNLDIFW